MSTAEDLARVVAALRTLAGAPPDASTFDVTVDGVTFQVTDASGKLRSLVLEAPYDAVRGQPPGGYRGAAGAPLAAIRPLEISLGYENANQRAEKAAGRSREVQTGDAAFDDEVYVDSPSDDAIVSAVLAPPEVRAAVRQFLAAGAGSVDIDDRRGKVWLRIYTVKAGQPPDAYARSLAVAFGALLNHLPRVARAPGRRPTDVLGRVTVVGNVLAAVGFVLGMPLLFGLGGSLCLREHTAAPRSGMACYGVPVLSGMAVGIPVSALVGYALYKWLSVRQRARSDGAGRTSYAVGVAVILILELSVAVASAIAWK